MKPDLSAIEGPGVARVRKEQRLHAYQEPVAARHAATVLLLRECEGDLGGFEVLMTRRSATASFAPGAYVFPGGALDASDSFASMSEHSKRRPGQTQDIAAFAYAAVREAFEELGVLLARKPDGQFVDQDQLGQLDRDTQDFNGLLAQHGLVAALDCVYWLAHWITDRDLPKRFDVQFLIAKMPPGQSPIADESEQFEPVWVKPADALARHERGEFDIIFPTIRTLRRLTRFVSSQAVIDACKDGAPMWTSCPRAGFYKGQVERYSEEELPFGELELLSLDGRVQHTLDWQHTAPIQLTQSVWRLTAPNPGMMTGPGTNTYLVGDQAGWVVIDPGPADTVHIERIASFVGSQLKMILCTHAHLDHSPGAFLLQKIHPAPIFGKAWSPPGYPSFTPDQELAEGQALRIGACTLRAIHTPGHASNHVCFFLEEDGLLFSGDHINSGSTVIINPPDGNMLHYIQELDRLVALDLSYILPAHGWVMGFPHLAIAHLKSHRLAREAKVMAALPVEPVPIDALLPMVYADVQPALYPAAKRSLLAHLQKLHAEGRARMTDDQHWALA
jgi:recombination protein RecT